MDSSGRGKFSVKQVFCLVVVVVAVITFVVHFESISFRQSGATVMREEIWRNNDPGGGAVTDMMFLLHGRVERVLGQLPVDPRENKSNTPWGSDPPESPCVQYKTRFGMQLPRVWLASFPGSGNTWTRYLLEAASGVFTGSVYTDKMLIKKGYLGEKDSVTSMRTLVQKIHEIRPCKAKVRECPEHNRTIPTVLLLRDPANAIISFYKFMKSKSHTKQINVSDFNTKSFHTFVGKYIRMWTQVALDRLLWTKAPLYVMHYEHLVQEPIKELTALLAFLGVPLDEGRMACIASHLDGSFKRTDNPAIDPYTTQEKATMAVETAAVNRTLLMMGYTPLPTYH